MHRKIQYNSHAAFPDFSSVQVNDDFASKSHAIIVLEQNVDDIFDPYNDINSVCRRQHKMCVGKMLIFDYITGKWHANTIPIFQ